MRIRLLWRSPGYRPVKMRPDQREVSLLMLGLPINPSYLQLARKSPLPVPSAEGQAPGMLHPQLTAILSPNTPQRLFFFPSPILLSPTSSVFSPRSLSSRSCQATCVTRGSGKKRFQNPLAREPQIYFWRAFFFSLKTKKPQGEIGNTGVKGVCFSFGRACLLSCPASVRTTALWGKRVAQTREEKCFSCKTAAKTMDPHLSPCHLATSPTCFPLRGHLLVFRALLCFDLFRPFFNFCLQFAVIKLRHLNACFIVNSFSSGIVWWACCRSIHCRSACGVNPLCRGDLLQ